MSPSPSLDPPGHDRQADPDHGRSPNVCFSPEASFVVGGALIPAGAYCLHAARRVAPRFLPLAAMPALYGSQQVAEGFVWLGLEAGDPDRVRAAAGVYLFFALAFWPFWNALSAAVGERSPARRRWLWGFTLLGTGWFWVAYYPLYVSGEYPLQIDVVHHSIRYQAPDLPAVRYLSLPVLYTLYLLNGAVPLVWGSARPGRVVGWMLIGSAVVTMAVFEYAFISVWCLFSALLAGYLCYASRRPDHGAQAAEGSTAGESR